MITPALSLGREYRDALAERPMATIEFYSYGVVLKRNTNGRSTEYPIDPGALAETIGARYGYASGLLSPHTLFLAQDGPTKLVVEYREPQITAIWIEGITDALQVPLPGLLMLRRTRNGEPDYRLYAVKERPVHLDIPLYAAPLPNTSTNGTCWGSVMRPSPEDLKSNDLSPDWAQFLGSQFNNHGAANKSERYPDDIRQLLINLSKEQASEYPLHDLQLAGYTLSQAIYGK